MKSPHDEFVAERQSPHRIRELLSRSHTKPPEKGGTTF
jgi:hypothetical protein